jgi:hypothetical protein
MKKIRDKKNKQDYSIFPLDEFGTSLLCNLEWGHLENKNKKYEAGGELCKWENELKQSRDGILCSLNLYQQDLIHKLDKACLVLVKTIEQEFDSVLKAGKTLACESKIEPFEVCLENFYETVSKYRSRIALNMNKIEQVDDDAFRLNNASFEGKEYFVNTLSSNKTFSLSLDIF